MTSSTSRPRRAVLVSRVYDRGATGSDIYKKISAEIARREKFLIHDFSAPELKKFRALLQRTAENVGEVQAKSRR